MRSVPLFTFLASKLKGEVYVDPQETTHQLRKQEEKEFKGTCLPWCTVMKHIHLPLPKWKKKKNHQNPKTKPKKPTKNQPNNNKTNPIKKRPKFKSHYPNISSYWQCPKKVGLDIMKLRETLVRQSGTICHLWQSVISLQLPQHGLRKWPDIPFE